MKTNKELIVLVKDLADSLRVDSRDFEAKVVLDLCDRLEKCEAKRAEAERRVKELEEIILKHNEAFETGTKTLQAR